MKTYYWRTKLYFKPFDSIWMVNFQRFLFYSCFFLVEGWRCWCGHGPINISLSSNNMFSFSFCWKWVWERFRCGLCPFSILVVLPLSPLTNLPSYLWWDSPTPQILPIRRNWWKYHCDLYICVAVIGFGQFESQSTFERNISKAAVFPHEIFVQHWINNIGIQYIIRCMLNIYSCLIYLFMFTCHGFYSCSFCV